MQRSLRSEYRQKLRDVKGDKDALKSLQKERAAKTTDQLSEKIASLLSTEQKEAVKTAAKQRGKKGKGKEKDKDAA